MIIFKVILLASLIRLLIAADKPFLCSGIYTFGIFALGLLSVLSGQAPFLALLIGAAIVFVLSSLYFWLLYRIGEGLWWWIVLILGVVIILL